MYMYGCEKYSTMGRAGRPTVQDGGMRSLYGEDMLPPNMFARPLMWGTVPQCFATCVCTSCSHH